MSKTTKKTTAADLLPSIEALPLEDLLTVAKKVAQLISDQEKEAERKINLIRNTSGK